jgi:hypothetical protein
MSAGDNIGKQNLVLELLPEFEVDLADTSVFAIFQSEKEHVRPGELLEQQ